VTVELFPRAEADIIAQFRYYLVDQNAPLIAVHFREAVMESINQLKPHPRIGSLFRGSIPGLRSYRLRVVRVLHGKRDVRRMLRQENVR
jgi:plasmid stabilization system protein ParE